MAEKLAEAMPDASWIESDEPEMESTLHYAQRANRLAAKLKDLGIDPEKI